MKKTRTGIIFLFVCICNLASSQNEFSSFLSEVSDQYDVEFALAPELIPILDSLHSVINRPSSLDAFLKLLLSEGDVSYRIVDHNKILLRREMINTSPGHYEIEGSIVDPSGQPLSWAAITLSHSIAGTYSDEEGIFRLVTDDTSQLVHIHYLGYKPTTRPISFFSGNDKKVYMEVSEVPLEEVVIIVPFHTVSSDDGAQKVDLKGYTFLSEHELLHGRADGLISRITGYTHYSSQEGIHIRSTEAENALFIMDGIPVYNPYHFYNIFSPFNGYYFTSAEIYKNNIPVEYGGRIDGMIRLDALKSTRARSMLVLETDLLASSLTSVIAFNDHFKMMAGGRFSYTALLDENLADSASMNFRLPGHFRDQNEWSSSQKPTFDFYDINLGIEAGIGDHAQIKAAYFKSNDYLNNTINTDFQITRNDNELLTISQDIESRDDWKNEGASVSITSHLTNELSVELSGYYSSYEQNLGYTSRLMETLNGMSRKSFNTGLQNSLLQSTGIRIYMGPLQRQDIPWKLGVEWNRYEVDLVAKENASPYLLEVQEGSEITLFGEYDVIRGDKADLFLGGRLTNLDVLGTTWFQPNLRLNYALSQEVTLKSSFSNNIQAVRELTVENRFGRETDFLALSSIDAGYPVLRSDKYMVGAGYLKDAWQFDVEWYYKKTDGLINVRAPRPDPSFDDQTSPGDFYQLYMGKGWTAGMDILASYKTKKTSGTISYTLSKISEQYDMLFNGNSFSPKEDRRHQLKLYSEWLLGNFSISGLLNYKTKAPYISLVRLEGNGGIGMVDQGNVLRYLPPYFSLDLELNYSFQLFKQDALLGISLINATDHTNINDLQHIGKIGGADGGAKGLFVTNETELLGRTVNVHFRYGL